MGSWTQHLPKLLIICIMAGAIYLIYRPENSGPLATEGGISPIYTSTTAQPPKYALHILFIGNSYTYVNNMPYQLVQIASTDLDNPTQFIVQSVTRGGIGLKELWDDGNALKILQSQHWDYVVLNQQSFWAMSETSVHETRQYARLFDEAIKKAGAKTLIYLTWPRKPGSTWYNDPKYSFLRNPNYMLKSFVQETHALAETLHAQTVEAGIYWANALVDAPEIDLYGPDGSHPSAAGSYVVALAFYKTLTGRDVKPVTYRPNSIDDAAALKLRRIVSGTQ